MVVVVMSFLDLVLAGIPDWLVRARWRERRSDAGVPAEITRKEARERRMWRVGGQCGLMLRDSALEQVRLMRACRVIRLFGRFSELKKMVAAVSASVLAMMHSFFIFILVMSICE